jgi:DNA topoisomerase-1
VLHLEFRGKGGAERELDVRDPQLATIVRELQELPGQSLFQYVDDDGQPHVIDSQDVNRYLNEVSGELITAKDFRTWGGTVAAADFLYRSACELADVLPLAVEDPRVRKLEVAAVRHAAQLLGNTLATCRAYYVHPQLKEAFARGEIAAAFRHARKHPRPRGLRIAERAVLHLLERWNGG